MKSCSTRSKIMLVLVFSVIILMQSIFWSDAQEECVVTVKNGTISGVMYTLPQKKICSYTGIPFAAPPVGELRFKAPQPAKAWGTLNAKSLPNWCPQAALPPAGVKISDDCLYLNVYHPKGSGGAENKGLPVMIWFHGGSFTSGSSSFYSPTKLLARGDIIYVAAHYRLGLLGFLSTNDEAAPGNFGLKDQAQAIRWVFENIHAFSGDPTKITVFGESAGGASVMYQLISPLNKGLIKGVISQSGTALATWALAKNPLESAITMAKRFGCPITNSTSAIVECVRNIDWKKIIEEQGKYIAASGNLWVGLGSLAPVVEPNLPGAFITEEPEKIMTSGNVPNIPVMIGATKHDGSLVLGTLYASLFGPYKLDQNPLYLKEKIVPDLLKFFKAQGDESNGALAASVEMAYLSGANRTSWKEIMPGLVDMVTVHTFKSSVQRSADILSKRNKNIYVYSFEHHSNNTLFWNFFFGGKNIPVEAGVTHGDELMYLFELHIKLSEADKKMSDTLCDMWINFAKHDGNPTPLESNKYDKWLPYNIMEEPYMKINVTPTLLYGYRNSWRPNGFQWN